MASMNGKTRVLIAEDDPQLLNGYDRVLRKAGYAVERATDGLSAEALIRREKFDVVLSDIRMPGLDGLSLLKAVRECDLDLPVVLMTGSPSLDSAIQAVERGALRYLVKPIDIETLERVVAQAASLRELAELKREALALAGGASMVPGDRAGLEARFGRALESLFMAYQPIVHATRHELFAYEALLRTEETSLPDPGSLLDAAERLGRLHELGRAIRDAVAQRVKAAPPPDAPVFVNLHAVDLTDESLFLRESPLSDCAEDVVLEITERATLDGVRNIEDRVATLRNMGYRIAIDDLGAGYAGLTSFAHLQPDVVKLDMSLVRGVGASLIKQKLISGLAGVCREMGMSVVVEGVEVEAERDTLLSLGCEIFQGYLYARPARAFPNVTWPHAAA